MLTPDAIEDLADQVTPLLTADGPETAVERAREVLRALAELGWDVVRPRL